MKNWSIRRRIALKSAVRVLARLVRKSRRHSKHHPLSSRGPSAVAVSAVQEPKINHQEKNPPTRRKSIHRATMAVEDGFKEF
jgi:hypothetical protein